MVRNFSNPLLMIRPFSTSRRRGKSGSSWEKAAVKDDVVEHARKISIDHTVLSGDESRHNTSQDFSRSFDVDASVEAISATFGAGRRSSGGGSDDDEALPMKGSRSEPTFLTHHSDGGGLCPCRECSPSPIARGQGYHAGPYSHPPGAPTKPAPPLASAKQPMSPRHDDPALQARTEAVRIQQQLLGANHSDVIFALSSLAKLHQKRGNHAEAASILRESRMRSMQANSSPQFSSSGRQEEQNIPAEISFPR